MAMPQEIALALASRSSGIKFWDVNNNVATQDISSATYQVDVQPAQVTPKANKKRQNMSEQPQPMEVTDLSSVSHGNHAHSEQLLDSPALQPTHVQTLDQSSPKRAMQRNINLSLDDDHTTEPDNV